jgi:hypothetical protein
VACSRENFKLERAYHGLRWLAGAFYRRWLSSAHVRFVVDKVAMVFSAYFSFRPVSIIPQMFHTHLHLHVVLTRRTNGRYLGTFQKAMPFSVIHFYLEFKGFHVVSRCAAIVYVRMAKYYLCVWSQGV